MLEPEIVSESRGWVCRYTPTVMSGPVFRWTRKFDSRGLFEVSASREGVMFHGSSPVFGANGLADLLAVVKVAERAHLHLSRDDRETEFVKRVIRGEV